MTIQKINWNSEKIAVDIAYTERQLKREIAFMSTAHGTKRLDVMKEVEKAITEIEQFEKLGSTNLFTVIGAFYDNPAPEAAKIILRDPMNIIYNRPFRAVPQIIEDLFLAAEAIAQPWNFTKTERREAIEKMPDVATFFYALKKHMND